MKLEMLRVGLVGLALTSIGCSGPEEEKFEFGQADMEAAVFGTWTGTFAPPGETAGPLTLEIRSQDEVARGLACASRSFSDRSATPGLKVQCGTHTSLAVSATLVAGEGASPIDFDGRFDVGGTTFSGGALYLFDRSSDSRHVTASLDHGTWVSCRYTDGPDTLGTCTLDARVEE